MISPDRLTTLLEAYGADPRRWPAAERADAQALLARSAEARALAQDAQVLDRVLDRAPLHSNTAADPAALAAIIAGTVQTPRPLRSARSWSDAFAARFAFGWANVAALAAAGIVGFLVGWTDLTQTAVGSRDMLDMIAPVTIMEEPLW
jgi:hypothetical protein